ncbi:MAG TPA: ATP-binding protein [Blastocatellia bacterium]|nr:ATP-binding protein [Blastocatellia bacterium]
MRLLSFKPLKLHTKTTILISTVLIAVFAVIAYFYDEFTTLISDTSEIQQAELVATDVADTVEHHIKGERRKGKERASEEESFEPDWTEVQDSISDTVAKGKTQLSEVRVFRKVSAEKWEEAVRLPEDGGPAFLNPPFTVDAWGKPLPTNSPAPLWIAQQGHTKLISVMARVFSPVNNGSPKMTAAVTVLFAFDENKSFAARLRRLIWPMMALAIVAITLITYALFRYIIYHPIDNLLLAMSKAEAGDLSVEAAASAPDEIGLLTSRFNRMLGRIRGMTDELNLHQRRLEDRVKEATAEIAERKEQLEDANLQLFEMQRQLTQLERLAAAGQLAAQFAHEVGTPLNLISGHVQLLRVKTADERVIKRLDIIAGQIERITNIVRSMLDSTRKPKPQLESVDVNALLARIFDATQPTLTARGVELRTFLADALPLIDADPDQLQQVFINLINNSLDAMPEGGVLHITTAYDEGSIEIELSDTGEGISKDQIEMIFDPLFTTKHGRGTGLGLTIVKQIISEHGGGVVAESEPGHGMVFHIRLPVSAKPAVKEAAREPLEVRG